MDSTIVPYRGAKAFFLCAIRNIAGYLETAHLVIEFIPGQDLQKIQEGNNLQPFPIEQVIDWAKAICDVLQHMHSQSPPVVHRDLTDNSRLVGHR